MSPGLHVEGAGPVVTVTVEQSRQPARCERIAPAAAQRVRQPNITTRYSPPQPTRRGGFSARTTRFCFAGAQCPEPSRAGQAAIPILRLVPVGTRVHMQQTVFMPRLADWSVTFLDSGLQQWMPTHEPRAIPTADLYHRPPSVRGAPAHYPPGVPSTAEASPPAAGAGEGRGKRLPTRRSKKKSRSPSASDGSSSYGDSVHEESDSSYDGHSFDDDALHVRGGRSRRRHAAPHRRTAARHSSGHPAARSQDHYRVEGSSQPSRGYGMPLSGLRFDGVGGAVSGPMPVYRDATGRVVSPDLRCVRACGRNAWVHVRGQLDLLEACHGLSWRETALGVRFGCGGDCC